MALSASSFQHFPTDEQVSKEHVLGFVQSGVTPVLSLSGYPSLHNHLTSCSRKETAAWIQVLPTTGLLTQALRSSEESAETQISPLN